METSPFYQITSKSGIVIASDLPRSAPAIQLQEGTLSKGDKPPKELGPGESSIVVYPLVQGRLVCRVTRTIEGIVYKSAKDPIEFIEPDPVPTPSKRSTFGDSMQKALDERAKPKSSATVTKQADAAIEETKARRGRGRKASS